MRALIVDDEPLARKRLARMLEKIGGVVVAGEAGDGREAAAKIAELAPDVVLLDIHMPEVDGLTVASQAGLPPIVFTTAYAEHAVRAFELGAIDYLLKPIEQERLEKALARVREAGRRMSASALAALLDRALDRPVAAPVRLSARSGSTVHLFDPREVARLHASDKYTVLEHGGREYVLDESLSTLEATLAPLGFLRVHRSELINLTEVRALHTEDEAVTAELRDGQRAPVSRRLLGALKEKLGLA